MRVIILSSNMSETGGIQRLTASLANSFVKHEYIEVHIINSGIKRGKEKFKLDNRIKNIYVNIEPKNFDGLNIYKKLIYNIKIYLKTKRFYRKYNFSDEKNIVIALGHFQSCILPYIIPKKDNIKIIGSQHNPITHNSIYSIIRKIVLKKLDKYVLINKTMETDLLEHYRLDNTCVIENPNEIKIKKSKLDNNIVLAVGRITEQKQFDILIEIWNKVVDENSKWKLKIIGDGPLKETLIKKIKEYNLEGSVILKGFNEHIEEEYAKADILAMTSKYEGFGLVLVEAQSSGLPTISFDCPFGPKSIINNGKDGFLIENNDINEFVDKLKTLMYDKEILYTFSKNAIENSNRFNIDLITEKWLELFNEV